MAAGSGLNMQRKIERFVCGKKGNGLRAIAEIKPGELIHSAQPFSFCIAKSFIESSCHSCFSRAEGLRRCSQCKSARYCSVQCQKEAWPEHKSECKCLKRIHPQIPTDSVRLTARILFRLLHDPAADSDELYSLSEHQSHLEEMSEQKREGLDHLCSMLMMFVGSDVPLVPSRLDPISLLARVTCNCFSISDGELQDIGVGLYPSMSLLNHDCRPNCVMVFVGKNLQLRAVRRIQPSEELCISYTDVLAPRDERRTHLMDQFHFLCRCNRCCDEQSDCCMLGGDEADWMKLRDSLPHLDELRTEQKWAELQREAQALIGCYSSVPDCNVYMLRILDAVMDACISLDRYEEALQYGRRTLTPYRLHYPDPHPSQAIEFLRVAKLQHYLGEIEQAEENFKQALAVLRVTHGDDHQLVTQVRMKVADCGAERSRADL